MTELKGSSLGPATDRTNTPVVDPTPNVMELVKAANTRQDDLRAAERELNTMRAAHNRELIDLYASQQASLDKKESARLDSIRQVDREDVAKTAAAANLAIATLAKQTTDLATTLQAQVGSTAAAAETRRSADMSEVNKRVSALELASSASVGKSTRDDPMLVELMARVERLAATQQDTSGVRRGADRSWQLLLGAAGFLLTLLSIGGVLYAALK